MKYEKPTSTLISSPSSDPMVTSKSDTSFFVHYTVTEEEKEEEEGTWTKAFTAESRTITAEQLSN